MSSNQIEFEDEQEHYNIHTSDEYEKENCVIVQYFKKCGRHKHAKVVIDPCYNCIEYPDQY